MCQQSQWVSNVLQIVFIHLFEGTEIRQHTDDLFPGYSQYLQQLKLAQVKASIQELNPDFPCKRQGLSYLSHQLLLPRCTSSGRQSGWDLATFQFVSKLM